MLYDDAEVRRAAVETLARLGDVRAVEPVLAMLKDSNEEVRRAAIEALVRTGDQDVYRRVVNDRATGDDNATELLVALLSDDDQDGVG